MKKKLLSVMALMLAVMGVPNAMAQSSWAVEEISTEKSYYLYNEAMDMFVGAGGWWGTAATLTDVGIPLSLEQVSGNVYKLSTASYYSGKYMSITYNSETKVAEDIYMDVAEGSASEWTIAVSEDSYTLYADGYYMASDGQDLKIVTGTSENTKWKLVSVDARKTALNVATEESPVNASFYLKTPDLMRALTSQWSGSPVGETSFANPTGHGVAEFYNCTYDFYQEVDVPNGIYELTCNGFYRAGNNASVANNIDLGYALLYANDNSVSLMSVLTEAGKTGQPNYNTVNIDNYGVIPDRLDAARDAVANGLYHGNSVRVIVTDGKLRCGVKKTQTIPEDWTVFNNFRLTYYGAAEDNALVKERQKQLTDLIAEATVENNGVNVGYGSWQIPVSAQTAFSEAISVASTKKESSVVEELETAISALKVAMQVYESAELNVPAEGQCFNVVMRQDNYIHDGKAVTFIANDRTDAGLYNIQYLTAPNANFAQALIFTKVAGESNVYTVSMMDIDGAQRYMCTGTVYGGTSSQIRTTLEADKAAKVKVAATDVEGVYTLLNVEANQFIGCQDYKADAAAGVFTTDQNHNLKIQEAEKATVELAANAGWATLALPFAAEIPAGLKVYSVAAVNNAVIELTDEGSLKANTPYIVNVTAEQKVSFSGWGLASSVTCNSGMLTGVFANTAAPVGSYVLQNQPDVDGVAFYNVVADAQPTVTANHAYLTLPAEAGANVRALLLPGSDATGIETVEAADATVDVYSISGVLVRSGVKKSEALNGLSKGIYIVGGVKRTVK